MGLFGGARDGNPGTALGSFGPAVCILAFCGIAGSGAEAAVVDLSASSAANTSISAIFDDTGQMLSGPVGNFFETGISGSELAQGDFVFVVDRDGNDQFSPSTITVDFGPGWSSASFLDPSLFYGGSVFGGVAIIESYRNISGMPLYAEFHLDYSLSAMVQVNEPRGMGTANASLLAEGEVWRAGAFSTIFDVAAMAGQNGPGSDSDGIMGTEVYSVFFEPDDYMEWTLLIDTDVSGSYTPIPLPGGLPLLAGGLGLVALAKRYSGHLRRPRRLIEPSRA